MKNIYTLEDVQKASSALIQAWLLSMFEEHLPPHILQSYHDQTPAFSEYCRKNRIYWCDHKADGGINLSFMVGGEEVASISIDFTKKMEELLQNTTHGKN
jgi:hypothetical protein